MAYLHIKGGDDLGFKSWLIDKLSVGNQPMNIEFDLNDFYSISAELHIRNLAFQSAVNLIANSISKCEFKTYSDGKEVKNKEYYLWNIEPNINQNSSQFIQKWINTLFEKNECLIVENNNQLFVADSFNVTEYALYGNQFSQVTIGDFSFNKTFQMNEVMYFKLNNSDIRRIVNGTYENYGKMIAYAQKSYQRSRGSRGILNVDSMAQGDPNFKETFEKLMNEHFKKYFESDNAVLPLFKGYEYNEQTSKTYSNEGTRDIRAMIDDVYDFTARAMRIPPAVLRGDMADIEKNVDNYLTFCIDPLSDMLQEEINRKRNGYSAFTKGTYTKIDTTSIKHIDLLGVATSIDKLISSGAFCINDIRKLTGGDEINEEWANKHFITKNYTDVENMQGL